MLRPVFFLLLLSASAQPQTPAKTTPRTSPWFDAHSINFTATIPGPPAPGSAADRADMDAVMQAQKARTGDEVKQAAADDAEEDIFIFANVLGPNFNAARLPLTAALSLHLREASAVVNPELKVHFSRPRPFVASKAVHPVCPQTVSNSYPSGHTMVGTLEALALTQIVPERAPEILARLDAYAHNRIVCGVHYPSDVAASRTLAAVLFGQIAASPVFQKELAAARAEVHAKLPEVAPGK